LLSATHHIGLISDTHGLLRERAVEALRGSVVILHAGDVGAPSVLHTLSQIAPVIAVRGNVDTGEWAKDLPETATYQTESTKILLLHRLQDLQGDPAAAGFQAVIFGHSHQPFQEERNGVLYLNPGAAGRKRFRLPVTVAILYLGQSRLVGEWVDIDS
jgi:uncharacterized protein